ncbi:PREDICTED: B-cell receptor-associated protein 31-like [Nelumbo nucifera]|uniref:Endoplasmic reticulum transmembrane protein n=1 Tax=Nelumbo nucifera TaxID=4432 RepID=A0A1U8BCP6_NELNU|nr:PREDICTED: B-cell receptor-associated protein 31-like [Nelumbo nucifera]
MIQLLFLVLFAEGIVAFLLMVKIGPLRDLVMKGMDQLKTGKGSATLKTIAGTMSVILASSIISLLNIQNKGTKLGTVTPMDQVLWRSHLLEASLMGCSLFLGFVIDRIHHYLQKLIALRTAARSSKKEVEKLQIEHIQLKEKEEKASYEIKLLQEEISSLKENLKNLKLQSDEKDKQIKSAESHVTALEKQTEDLLLEYDRLLDDSQHLQAQVVGYRG